MVYDVYVECKKNAPYQVYAARSRFQQHHTVRALERKNRVFGRFVRIGPISGSPPPSPPTPPPTASYRVILILRSTFPIPIQQRVDLR